MEHSPSRLQSLRNLNLSTLVWVSVVVFTALCVVLKSHLGALAVYPKEWVLPLTDPMNQGMRAFVNTFGFIFKAIAWVFDWPIFFAQSLFGNLPWFVALLLIVAIGFASSANQSSGKPKLGLPIFAALAVLYMVLIGLWPKSVNSFALVVVSVPIAVTVGFFVGALGFKSQRARRAIMPLLDLLQTIPAFAYLLPILLLFGFGTTVGLVASVLFAFPPMVRNTILGLDTVSDEVIESGLMSGATKRQLFWQVQVPSARRHLLLGVNQTTMASLSMVIIAAIIGGSDDIGWEVLSTMRKAQFGESLLAGLVIALIAMLLDRMTAGFAAKASLKDPTSKEVFSLSRWIFFFVSLAVLWILIRYMPLLNFLDQWPKAWRFEPADSMNEALKWFIRTFREQLAWLKNKTLFFFMLPVKIGLKQAVSPFTWGFALTPLLTGFYALLVVALALLALLGKRFVMATAVCLTGLILYHGITGTPWIAILVLTTAIAWQVKGKGLAIGTALGLLFLATTGIWQPAMVSVYLCSVSVLLAFGLGSLVGIWAAENDRVSAVVRPFIDTLQTMPLFVILIPFVMVFKIGEFTALLAILAYAIVPAIRYTEHGLRNIPEETLEAATMIGTTRFQRLLQVKLPLAYPSLMLGLNQTIMFGISMLVITALVGTSDLGQQIYIGLGDGDFGIGMTAGLGMAIIAMIADRITQAISKTPRASA